MDIRRETPPLSKSDADALLAGRVLPTHEDLNSVLSLLRTAVAAPAPPPSAALAAVLRDGLVMEPAAAPASVGHWRSARAAAAAVAAALITTLGAATANALPAPLQHSVADAVSALTPFELPRSDLPATTTPTPGEQPTPTPTPSPALSPSPDTGTKREPTAKPLPFQQLPTPSAPERDRNADAPGEEAEVDPRGEDASDGIDHSTGDGTDDGSGEAPREQEPEELTESDGLTETDS